MNLTLRFRVKVNHCMQSTNGKGRYETITICCEELNDYLVVKFQITSHNMWPSFC